MSCMGEDMDKDKSGDGAWVGRRTIPSLAIVSLTFSPPRVPAMFWAYFESEVLAGVGWEPVPPRETAEGRWLSWFSEAIVVVM